ncbi:YaaA family protein [Brevibacterium litoralis]|uniref:YaaA family protein n=1 Tax=Brevibacterium litoralis TaxID=3138935 RepID=UPI0032EDC4FB
MIVLLPPSEGKTPADSGPTLDLWDLHFPDLAPERRTVLDTLREVSAAPDALERLGVGKSLGADVERNTRLETIPCAPALLTYTGVLYAALGLTDSEVALTTDGGSGTTGADTTDDATTTTLRARLEEVYVSSGLFGIVGALDPVPAYRLAMKTKLGDLGTLSTWWKKRLSPVLDEEFAGRPVLDCRSTDYRKSWPGDPALTAVVNVFTEKDGKRTVVSHNAKHTRGELVGHLLRDPAPWPEDLDSLVERAAAHYRVEFTASTGRKPAALDVVL